MKTKSKKQLVAAIVAGLTLATAAPAFAAANPFVDVPAKHWAYDAVSKLAAAGIIDGYGDGTFRGDRTTTRYEMAQIVGKAMANQDKANAEQKAMIDKLAQEFDDELKSLGVRVSTLENKVGNIKWSGQVRSWYEHVDDNIYNDTITDRTTRLLLFMEAPLTDDLTFKGRLWAQTGWGDRTEVLGTGSDVSMDQAYIQGKNFTFGRQGIMLGKGLTYAWFPNNDGATYTIGGDKAKLTLAAFKANDFALLGFPGDALNMVAADAYFKANDDLDFTLTYAKNRESDFGIDLIKTWAIGTTYKGIDNVTITAEYGQNASDLANILNFGDDAKGLVAQIKYRGAQWDKEHSWGTWVGYRKADLGFFGRNGDYIWETPVMFLTSHPLGVYAMDDVKGFDVGFDYTLFKNGILTLQYFDLENEQKLLGDIDKKGFVGQLRYMF